MTDPVSALLRRAGRAVSARAGDDRLTLRDKNEDPGQRVDLVTEADLLVDTMVTEGLDELFAGVPVVSEERPAPEGARGGDLFLLDPVDGTHNFASGVPWWAISLARVRGDTVEEAWLLEVPTGRMFHATTTGPARVDGAPIAVTTRPTRLTLASVALSYEVLPILTAADRFAGVRSMGCASLGLAWAAEGRFCLHAARNWPWDVGAGYLLVERAGGMVVDFAGNPITVWDRVYALAGAPSAVQVALELLSG